MSVTGDQPAALARAPAAPVPAAVRGRPGHARHATDQAASMSVPVQREPPTRSGGDAMLPPQAGATEVVPLDMQVHWDNRAVTVILTGELDCASAPDLTARLTDLLAKRPQRLVLDLANVAFMDCAGITPIARARRALPPGHPVILRSPARQARQLLKITHIDQLCTIQDNLTATRPLVPPFMTA
jgi:anti-sigma B factor antagonist